MARKKFNSRTHVGKVVGGRRKEKFHDPHCAYASTLYLHGANRVVYASARKARADGMIPCRLCLGYEN